MGFFNMFSKKYVPLTQDSQESAWSGGDNKSLGFSTPFLNIGDGNLSLPQVNKYYTQNGFVRFGSDNLYPQLLNQMYYTSAIHGACVDFITNATIGGGFSYKNEPQTARDKVLVRTFERINKIKKLSRSLTRDYVLHNRVAVLVHKKADGTFIKFTRLDPSTIRHSELLDKFAYNPDWSRGMVGFKEYRRHSSINNDIESLYIYQEDSPGQDVYPIPAYNSILNWVFLDGEQAFFQKSNIQNSIFPSLVIRRPKNFQSKDEAITFKEALSPATGAKGAGKIMVLTGNGMDDVPEVIQLKANDNDKLFVDVTKDIKENISIAHKINPAIMGVKVAGSLGNSQEIAISYQIFEKNVIMLNKDIMEEIMNDLYSIADIPFEYVINDFNIIEGQLEESEEVVMSKEEEIIENQKNALDEYKSSLKKQKSLNEEQQNSLNKYRAATKKIKSK